MTESLFQFSFEFRFGYIVLGSLIGWLIVYLLEDMFDLFGGNLPIFAQVGEYLVDFVLIAHFKFIEMVINVICFYRFFVSLPTTC